MNITKPWAAATTEHCAQFCDCFTLELGIIHFFYSKQNDDLRRAEEAFFCWSEDLHYIVLCWGVFFNLYFLSSACYWRNHQISFKFLHLPSRCLCSLFWSFWSKPDLCAEAVHDELNAERLKVRGVFFFFFFSQSIDYVTCLTCCLISPWHKLSAFSLQRNIVKICLRPYLTCQNKIFCHMSEEWGWWWHTAIVGTCVHLFL